MATLLIILLGTMLIQGSSLAVITPRHPAVRGSLKHEFSGARHTLLNLALASLWGHLVARELQHKPLAWLQTLLVLLGASAIVALTQRLLAAPAALSQRSVNLTVELTTQGASLGMALFCASTPLSLGMTVTYGLGSGLVLIGLTACFNALRERLERVTMPLGFRGIPIALITTGFMALALMGFAGMVRN